MLMNTRIVQEYGTGKFLVQFETLDGWETEGRCDTMEEAVAYQADLTD